MEDPSDARLPSSRIDTLRRRSSFAELELAEKLLTDNDADADVRAAGEGKEEVFVGGVVRFGLRVVFEDADLEYS